MSKQFFLPLAVVMLTGVTVITAVNVSTPEIAQVAPRTQTAQVYQPKEIIP